MTDQAAYQARHIAAGLCRSCPQPAVAGRLMCAKCAATSNAAHKRWRLNNPGRDAAALKATREKYRARGDCLLCGKPRAKGRLKCEAHLARARADWRAHIARNPPKKKGPARQTRRVSEAVAFWLRQAKGLDQEGVAWAEAHPELFYDKGDRFLWNAAPLPDEE